MMVNKRKQVFFGGGLWINSPVAFKSTTTQLMFRGALACYYANQHDRVPFMLTFKGSRGDEGGMGGPWLVHFNPSLKIWINPLHPITMGAHVPLSTTRPFRAALLTV